MAKKDRQAGPEEETTIVDADKEVPIVEPPVPSDIPADRVAEGDELFPFTPDTYSHISESNSSISPIYKILKILKKCDFSNIQKALITGIFLIGTILLYGILKSRPQPHVVQQVRPTVEHSIPNTDFDDFGQAKRTRFSQQTYQAEKLATSQISQPPEQYDNQELATISTESLSLKTAETFYLQRDFPKAYANYKQLSLRLPPGQEESLRDFLELRMALCVRKAGREEQADRLLRATAQSRYPVVAVVSSHQLILSEMQRKQYFNAAVKAYQTMALADAVDHHRDWASALQHECHFLIAEAMTRNVLSLLDADADLPPQLWPQRPDLDPFANISEAQLRAVLTSGADKLNKALLGPQIERLDRPGTSSHWSVICNRASINELLARFASNTGLDIQWSSDATPSSLEIQRALRKRPVTLCMSSATPQQIITVAAGSVGLLAKMDTDKTVTIFNPLEQTLLSEYTSMLSKETISLWQRLLLTSYGDRRVPNIHFALALLHALSGNPTEAIAEYKLVANRFPQTSLAQHALFNSSKIKVQLRDYFGARDDLKQLVEQYPGNDLANEACLYLADVTMKAELWDEAARLYGKVYDLGISTTLKTAAALGAGKCSYQKGDYEAAAKWLTKYLRIATESETKDAFAAYLLLGKTFLALGKADEACDAFQYALNGPLPRQQYIQTIAALVEAHIQQGRFIEALGILENTHAWPFSQKESVEIMLLRARGLRSMGLIDKAIAALSDMAQYLPDPQLKAKLSFELAKCYISSGDLELARKTLGQILVYVEPGTVANQVKYELAGVCLKLGKNTQAISFCEQLLKADIDSQTRKDVSDLMAAAYTREKDFDRAILALLDPSDINDTAITAISTR